MENVFLFFCSIVAVSVVVEGLVNDHEQLEYRLAPKRYHRKIRSELPEFPSAVAARGKEDFKPSFQLPPLYNFTPDESVAASTSSATANSSFLLDLPFPSHFLFSLQLLNVSLPFIGDGVQVPEDPPLPTIDIQDVLNNTQYFRPAHQETPLESKALLESANPRPLSGRRSVNRIRNRIPAHLRHLPKRSVEQNVPESVGRGTILARDWNASSSIQRRQEFHAKLRATTTPRPGLTKKLLYRRANSTSKFNKLKAHVADRSSGAKPLALNVPEQDGAPTRQHETSFTGPGLVLGDSEHKRTKMSGFIFTNDRTSVRPVFPASPSSGFVPLIPHHALQKDRSPTTESAKSFVPRFPQKTANFNAKPAASNDFPRFEGKHQENNGQPAALSASEITQIQKPETFTVKTETLPAKEDTATTASSTSLPIIDVALNLTFPSFELPNADGSKAAPPTLPPPLSIEELIKKFTGSDPITDPPIVRTSLPDTANQLSDSVPFTTGRGISQSTNSTAPFNPELRPAESLQDNLKQLLTVTSTGRNEALLDVVSTQAPGTVDFKFQIPSPIKESDTTEATRFLSQTFSLPVAESPKSSSETVNSFTTIKETATSENPVLVFPVALNFSDISNSTTVSKNQSVSVQRGPLDVSSLDTSFGGGFQQGGFQQGGFQQGGFQQGGFQQGGFQQGGFQQPSGFGFQSVGFQQQQQPSGNDFAGFQGGSLSPADFAAGQQNPFYYSGGFPAASAGQGQLQQGGFDGLLHYGPTGPPAGEYNAITQGLSLLASFGGGYPSGGQQFAIQQPASFQQGQTFGDFSTASLQSASQIQPTVNIPSQGFYAQGFPSFNIIQPQPQASYQLVPNQQQQAPYQIAQSQSYQPTGQAQQFQQVYSPSSGAQQPYQLVASGNPASGGFPTQLFQVQPQSAVFQSAGQAAQAGSAQLSINPAQFGTLLSGASLGETGAPAGTASVTSLSSSTSSGDTATSDKASSSSASQIVEVQLKSGSDQAAGDSVPVASEIIELIAIGPESLSSESKSSKKSYFKRGLRSGYYS